jgi:hypothetical protein
VEFDNGVHLYQKKKKKTKKIETRHNMALDMAST